MATHDCVVTSWLKPFLATRGPFQFYFQGKGSMTFFFWKKKDLHFHLRKSRTGFWPFFFFCLQLLVLLVTNSHVQLLQIHRAHPLPFSWLWLSLFHNPFCEGGFSPRSSSEEGTDPPLCELGDRGQGEASVPLHTSELQKGCRVLWISGSPPGSLQSWHCLHLHGGAQLVTIELLKSPEAGWRIRLAGKDISKQCAPKVGGRNTQKKKTFPFLLFSLYLLSLPFPFLRWYRACPPPMVVVFLLRAPGQSCIS